MGQCWEILNFTYSKTKQNKTLSIQDKPSMLNGKKTGINTSKKLSGSFLLCILVCQRNGAKLPNFWGEKHAHRLKYSANCHSKIHVTGRHSQICKGLSIHTFLVHYLLKDIIQGEEEDGRGVGGCGIHLSPWIHQE